MRENITYSDKAETPSKTASTLSHIIVYKRGKGRKTLAYIGFYD